jgi:hypothetical protein
VFFFLTGNDDPMVIFSRRHEIRQMNLRDLKTVSLVSGLRNTIALDFLWEKKYLFWTDVGDDKIYRGTIMSNSMYRSHPPLPSSLCCGHPCLMTPQCWCFCSALCIVETENMSLSVTYYRDW